MRKEKYKRLLIITGIIGFVILTVYLLWVPGEELKTKSSIVTAVSLFIISANNILQGLLTKKQSGKGVKKKLIE